jgi:hypothetical protein
VILDKIVDPKTPTLPAPVPPTSPCCYALDLCEARHWRELLELLIKQRPYRRTDDRIYPSVKPKAPDPKHVTVTGTGIANSKSKSSIKSTNRQLSRGYTAQTIVYSRNGCEVHCGNWLIVPSSHRSEESAKSETTPTHRTQETLHRCCDDTLRSDLRVGAFLAVGRLSRPIAI